VDYRIRVIRKFKAWFIRLRLDVVVYPVAGYLIYLGQLAKLARWTRKQADREVQQESGSRLDFIFNDFYNPRVAHPARVELYEHVRRSQSLSEAITYVEFGVGYGNSMRWWLANQQHPESAFYGFDTFTGLPDDFGTYAKGTFDVGGEIPDVGDDRCTFVKGLFQETLRPTLPLIDFTRRAVFHFDADLYSSTLYALATLHPHMKRGDLLFFDEFGTPTHEFQAFCDFVRAFGVEYRLLGAKNNYLQTAFVITR
jgi:hypothetical protein